MADYYDQLLKQFAVKRKAFAVAQSNPAVMPTYWNALRSIANGVYEYMRQTIISGCSFPDRPISLSENDASLLNFGTTPDLIRRDHLALAAEAGEPPRGEGEEPLGPEREKAFKEQLVSMIRTFGTDHAATRIYNLEPWIQDMYRDRLDVDYAEDLQRRIEALNTYMDTVPRALQATGLQPKLAAEIMEAFKLFKGITGSSHMLERDKMSFVDRRTYANVAQQIEAALTKADEALGASANGRSPVRELFAFYREANYDMMELTHCLRAVWAGTSLDDRIRELELMAAAIQRCLNRCAEECADNPRSQTPVWGADPQTRMIDRETVRDAFLTVLQQETILTGDGATILSRREMLRYGPLCIVMAGGEGRARYAAELRRMQTGEGEDEPSAKAAAKKKPGEREMDLDRRTRYPLNFIVVPNRSDPGDLVEDLTDAWLEYNSVAFPMAYKEFLDGAKANVPAAFAPPQNTVQRQTPLHNPRHILAKLLSRATRWLRYGVEPQGDGEQNFVAFRDWLLKRLTPPKLLIPLRYQPILDLFNGSRAKRKAGMWRRFLGPRYMLDRQLVAICILQKDWSALRDALKYLNPELRQNPNLLNAFAKLNDKDMFAEHKAIHLFRRFMADDPDLKTAMVSTDSQIAIELETLRIQAESLGRQLQYDQVSVAMMRRQRSMLQEQRNIANRHIDQYLTGLMYAIDGSHEAAISALTMCLVPRSQRKTDKENPAEIDAGSAVGWFSANLAPRTGTFEKKKVPGVDTDGTLCHEFVYYNLGQMYRQLRQYSEARMCFRGFLDQEESKNWHQYCQWAKEMSNQLKAEQEEAQAVGESRK